jgi:hypothetical protein
MPVRWPRDRWLSLVLLATYMVVIGYTLHQHAMWRDELQAWLVARDSANITELFHNLHYEGHPALWYLLLTPLTYFSRNPVWMQLLHFVIAASVVALVLWRAPLSTLERVLFPFGYFILYEYAVKSRNYAPGCLLLFVFCALWPRRRQSPVVLAIMLALMANVHFLFTLISVGAVAALVVDRLGSAPSDTAAPAAWRADVLAIVIVSAGWVLAIATVMPPPDSGYFSDWYFGLSTTRLSHSALTLLALLLVAVVRFRNNPAAATFLVVSLLALLSFFYTKIPGGLWHHGLGAIVFFAAVWMDRISARAAAAGPLRQPLVPATLFALALAVQVPPGVLAIAGDLRQPLSSSRDVAQYITAQGWIGDPIIGTQDNLTGPIVGYLGVDRVYYANGRRWGSFTIWDQHRLQPVDLQAVLEDAQRFGPFVTFIADADAPVDAALLSRYGFEEVASFNGAADSKENYSIYRSGAKAIDRPLAALP